MASRKTLTVKKKLEIIKLLEEGKSNAHVSKKFLLNASTISTIFRNRSKIKNQLECFGAKSKRFRRAVHSDIEEALYKWFKYHRSLGVPIDGKILQAKANEFAKLRNKENFNCSESWIQRFRARRGIVFKKKSEKSSKIDSDFCNNWFENVWPNLRKGYKDEEIFNADETGIFYKVLPDETIKLKGEKCFGGKLSKERITVLVSANMTGSTKMELVVIGKSKNPRCFKNINILPVQYHNNQKAWMTSILFEQILRQWDASLGEEKRKILLLIDSCPAHPQVENLQYIKLVFLPSKCTFTMQPFDRGVIKSLKFHFRKELVLNMIRNRELNLSNKITLLEGIQYLSKAWKKVRVNTIVNCFEKAGFKKHESNRSIQPTNFNDETVDEISLSELRILLKQYNISNQSWNNYIKVDEKLITNFIPSDAEIVNEITNENEEESDNETEENEIKVLNTAEAVKAAENLKGFIYKNCNSSKEVIDAILAVDNYVKTIFTKQQIHEGHKKLQFSLSKT